MKKSEKKKAKKRTKGDYPCLSRFVLEFLFSGAQLIKYSTFIRRTIGPQLRKKKEGKEKKELERLPPFAAHSTRPHPRPKESVLRGKQTKRRLSHLLTDDITMFSTHVNQSTSCFMSFRPNWERPAKMDSKGSPCVLLIHRHPKIIP